MKINKNTVLDIASSNPLPCEICRPLILFFLAFLCHKSPKKVLRILFKIQDDIVKLINHVGMRYEGGIHPKHRLTQYHDFFTNKAYNATKFGRERIVNYFFHGYIQDISTYINVYLTEKNLEKIKKQEKHRYLPNKYQFISHEFEYPKKLRYAEELNLERLIKNNQNQYKEKQKKFNERRQRRKVNVVYFNTKSTKSKKITYRSRYNFRNLKKVLESESEMLNYY